MTSYYTSFDADYDAFIKSSTLQRQHPTESRRPKCSVHRRAAPDAWGRRVVGYKYPDLAADELDYLLLSGSNRIGALDFQASASEYVPRESDHPTLDDLLQAAELLEANRPLPPELDGPGHSLACGSPCRALLQGTRVGGARPKALIDHGGKHFIAKFSSATDIYPVVKAEYIAMRLAALAGLAVAPVSLASSLCKDVLMIERFDRMDTAMGKARRSDAEWPEPDASL